jgi:hypothetical protein
LPGIDPNQDRHISVCILDKNAVWLSQIGWIRGKNNGVVNSLLRLFEGYFTGQSLEERDKRL